MSVFWPTLVQASSSLTWITASLETGDASGSFAAGSLHPLLAFIFTLSLMEFSGSLLPGALACSILRLTGMEDVLLGSCISEQGAVRVTEGLFRTFEVTSWRF